MKRVALALGLAACGFPKPKDVPDDSGGSGAHDAAVHDGASADGVSIDAPAACLSFRSQFFDACKLPAPVGSVTVPAGAVLDTSATPPAIGGLSTQPTMTTYTQSDNSKVIVIVVNDFDIQGPFQVIGGMPVMIAAYGTITVEASGVLDASSTKPTSLGAGANPGRCGPDGRIGQNGTDANASAGSGGGGGGAYGTSGGTGGKGGNMWPGGPNGTSTGRPTTIVGGCPGGASAAGPNYPTDPTAVTPGGGGGGAVLLSTATSIRVSGRVLAGGQGGEGSIGNGSRTGGGGGGAGGLLVLEGPSVSVLSTAVVAANGGGGGGSSGNAQPGFAGVNALPSTNPAQGGAGGGGCPGVGGPGAAGANPAAMGGQGNATCGGGGGGGGAGYILVYGPAAGITLNGTISPPPIVN